MLLKVFGEGVVQFFTRAQSAVNEAYGFHDGLHCRFHVGQAEDILLEDIFDAFFFYGQAGEKLVTAFQRRFESHLQAGHHSVDALFVQFGETDALRAQKLVAGVFDVVLVVGVVDDAL